MTDTERSMEHEDRITVLAQAFTKALVEALNPAQLAEIARRNQADGADSMACHSHDFCDANEYMWSAWNLTQIDLMDLQDESHASLVNDAWDEARARWFYLWVWMPFLDALAAKLDGEVDGADGDDVLYGRITRPEREGLTLYSEEDGGATSVTVGPWLEDGRGVYSGDLDLDLIVDAVARV